MEPISRFLVVLFPDLINMKNKIVFILFFTVLGFLTMQIPIATIHGSRVPFTFFDMIAPITGAFLGLPFGIASVFVMQLVNHMVHGFAGVETNSILKLIATLRFLPMVFGVWYFVIAAKKSRKAHLIQIVPLICIVAFNLNPIGRTVWYYSLFWLVPVVMWQFRQRFILARSLGATFTAHAIGGAVWIWAFNLPATVWQSLIPVIFVERLLFAFGISASFIMLTNLLAIVDKKKILTLPFSFDKKYVIKALK